MKSVDRGVAALSLVVDEAQVAALIRALYVVKDNWWLDETEEELLARLEALERESIQLAAAGHRLENRR
ncbi:MAG: hypothetical protein C5B48_14295 [Candidatus Rokuibacteriota bacterium]|nr:MAG: hypothetical protein C5B48_14295 [Candidatus Rokubacteria bacterium]